MKTFKELINELDTETLMSHHKKRLAQSGEAYKKGDYQKAYNLKMRGSKSHIKALLKQPEKIAANDTRGYDKPNRYHGD